MLFSLLCMVAVMCFLYYYSIRTFNYWRNKKVAGPKPVPFFGNLMDSVFRRKHLGMVYKGIYDQFPNERVIGIYRLTNPTLLVRDLDLVKQILIKNFDVFPERGINFTKERLGDNLFHCDSTVWKILRPLLTPLFTAGKLRNAVPLVDKYAQQLINFLEMSTSRDKESEMHQIFQKYTMASTIATFFDLDIDFFKGNQKSIEQAGQFCFKSTYTAEMTVLFPNIWTKINISLYSPLVKNFCYEVVRIIKSQKNGLSTNKNNCINALLAIKGRNGIEDREKEDSKCTDHVLAGQVFVFFAAGFGNNALILSYALFRLAKHQDIQDKLINEIDTVLEKYDGRLTLEALKEMSYLDKVFLETLRMNTLTNAIQRSAKNNYTIPGTDIVIEKGTTVLISPYAIHRDEKIYPDPEHFDPERFSSENKERRHPCAYIPFGAGLRSCVGRQLAKLQFAVAIVRLFSKFRVEPSEKTKLLEDYDPMHTLLATKEGVHVNIIPRNI